MVSWTVLLVVCSILVLYTIWSLIKVIGVVSKNTNEEFLNYTRDVHSRLPGFIQNRVDSDRVEGVVDKLNKNPLVKYNPYVYVGKKILDKVSDSNPPSLPIFPKAPKNLDDRPELPNIPKPPKWLHKVYGK